MPPRKSTVKPQLRNVAAILNRESLDTSAGSEQSVPIEQIKLPKKQPRRYFDPVKLAQLVQSVKEHGILEPLLVRPRADGEYELVAGERRLRAAREAGLEHIPIVVHQLDDRQAMQVALMENLQREDLNPVEETEAVLDLLSLELGTNREEVISLFYQAHRAKHRGQELGQNVLSQLEVMQALIEKVGRFTLDSFRSSRIPLLNLPDDVLNVLRQGKLEYTKAQAVARVKDKQHRAELLKLAVSKNLSLSEIKTKVNSFKADAEIPAARPVEQKLTQRWNEVGKRFRNSANWDSKKRNQIVKLLDELDKLTADDL